MGRSGENEDRPFVLENYTVKRIATKLGLNREWVRRALRDGLIPGAFRFSPRGQWRVSKAIFDDWLKRKQQATEGHSFNAEDAENMKDELPG